MHVLVFATTKTITTIKQRQQYNNNNNIIVLIFIVDYLLSISLKAVFEQTVVPSGIR